MSQNWHLTQQISREKKWLPWVRHGTSSMIFLRNFSFPRSSALPNMRRVQQKNGWGFRNTLILSPCFFGSVNLNLNVTMCSLCSRTASRLHSSRAKPGSSKNSWFSNCLIVGLEKKESNNYVNQSKGDSPRKIKRGLLDIKMLSPLLLPGLGAVID